MTIPRDPRVRSDLEQWREDKLSFEHPRMRNLEPRLLDHRTSIEQEIKIQGPWPPARPGSTVPSVLCLNPQEHLDQSLSGQKSLNRDDTVEKVRLIGDADRGSLHPVRSRDHAGIRQPCDLTDRGLQSHRFLAQVGTKPDVRDNSRAVARTHLPRYLIIDRHATAKPAAGKKASGPGIFRVRVWTSSSRSPGRTTKAESGPLSDRCHRPRVPASCAASVP